MRGSLEHAGIITPDFAAARKVIEGASAALSLDSRPLFSVAPIEDPVMQPLRLRLTTKRLMIVVAVVAAVFAGQAYLRIWSMRPLRVDRHQATTLPRETAMSFDIYFHTCNLSTQRVQVKNPFTGKTMEKFDDPGLTGPERAAVGKLLRQLSAGDAGDSGSYSIGFPDGGEADLLAPGLTGEAKFDGCSVGSHGLTNDVVEFLFRLSAAGNMMIVPATEGTKTLVTSDAQRKKIAARYPDAKVIRSAEALGEELRRGIENWRRYGNQVIEGSESQAGRAPAYLWNAWIIDWS
jgi:hypothetical protein